MQKIRLNPQRLGCLTPLGLLFGLITLLAIAGSAVALGGAMFSPDSLNAQTGPALGGITAHSDLSETCETCHLAPWEQGGMTVRCLDCHQAVKAEFSDPASLHSIVVVEPDRVNCLKCHTEHHGPAASLTRMQESSFDHERTRYSLVGHEKLSNGKAFECQDCHTIQLSIMEVATCTDCHQEIDSQFMQDHQAAFSPDCLNCHQGETVFGKAFRHDQSEFPLEGKHEPVQCQACHQQQATIAQMQTTPTDCNACHLKDDIHKGAVGTDCAACHSAADWMQIRFNHEVSTTYPLTGQHLTTACVSCHINQVYKGTPIDCVACHLKDDEHQNMLGPNCAECHVTQVWKPSSFNHTQSTYPLTGAHLQTACSECHSDILFIGTPSQCAACHEQDDVHGGALTQECTACHTTEAWKPSTFDHVATVYPLTGAHASVECAGCHADQIYTNTPQQCEACHQADDPHSGVLGSNCAGCHTTQVWAPSTFNHAQSAFQLTGTHNQVACRACHTNQQFKGTSTQCSVCHANEDVHSGVLGSNCTACHTTQTWVPTTFNHTQSVFQLTGMHVEVNCAACHADKKFKGAPSQCVDCHSQDDPHAGAFGVECATCHSTQAWTPPTFDHAASVFPLTGNHLTTACAACHQNAQFKGTPTTCVACHASIDAHQGGLGTECAACHNTTSWQDAGFDHSTSDFPLTGAHASLPCQTCHTDNQFVALPVACASCHGEPAYHAGLLGTDCAACHNTAAWLPALYSNAHTFPVTHGGADSCQTCHVKTLAAYTCFRCHDRAEITEFHTAQGITDITNCAACHGN